MKSMKHIILGAALAIGAFCTVIYTSCSKDACKGVTCQNGGTCSGGNCTCVVGYGGTNCEIIYRTTYTNTYQGNGTDNTGGTYTNFRLVLTANGTDVTKMTLAIQDATGGSAGVPILTIDLSNFTSTGSSFTVESNASVSGLTYTGSGTISATSASLSLVETPTTGSATTYTFNNMAKQ